MDTDAMKIVAEIVAGLAGQGANVPWLVGNGGKRAMSSGRVTGGIFTAAAIMLFALLVLIVRGGSSIFLRDAALITLPAVGAVLGLLLARRFPLRRFVRR
jgi:hypothetical protein